jgi:hypothetical protein
MPIRRKQSGGCGSCKGQSGTGIYDRVGNYLTGSKMRDGEVHAPQYVNGKFTFGNYIGPNTEVEDRLKDKSKPVSETDRIARLHDVTYSLAETPEDVRAADLRMVKNLNKARKSGSDNIFNTTIGAIPIKAKMWAEDRGLMKPGSFANLGEDELTDENRELFENLEKSERQQGYGRDKGNGKYVNWKTHLAECRKKNKDKSYKACMKLASKSYRKNKDQNKK